VSLLREAFRILRPHGVLGVIHWVHDARTPRGPDLRIRPRPFVNPVALYRALKETFQASHPEFHPDKQRLEGSSAPKLRPLWRTLWLVNGFLGQAIFQYSPHAKTLPQLLDMSWAHLAGVVLHLPLIAVVWVLISTMQRWQTARVSNGAAAAT
jgi:hypothetical protein